MASSAPAAELGRGIYAAAEAARLLRVSEATIRQWIRAVGFTHRLATGNGANAVDFRLLIELHLVGILVQGGESLVAIALLIKAARERLHADCPLSYERFATEADIIIDGLIRDETGLDTNDWEHARQVLRSDVTGFLQTVEFGDDGEPVRYWPPNGGERVVLDAGRQRGKPIDAATGVPTWAIYAAIHAGGGQEPQEVAKWFDVPLAAVEAAMAFEESLAP